MSSTSVNLTATRRAAGRHRRHPYPYQRNHSTVARLGSYVQTLANRGHRAKIIILIVSACLAFFLLGRPGGQATSVAAQTVWASSSVLVSNGSPIASNSSLVTPTVAKTQTFPTSQVTATVNASSALQRINQLDPNQYDSPSDAGVWAESACSTAAITEVLNSYGFHFRLADILHAEAQNHWITPQDGLLEDGNIEKTAALFGFSTTWGHALSLDQMIATANAGHPIIISFPPGASPLFPPGHILVVTGGDETNVKLADSSSYHLAFLSRQLFSAYWRGLSAVLEPPTDRLAGKPTIGADFINRVLASYHSPAAGLGQSLYDLGVKYGIDPVYALAFFKHESQFGTTGEAQATLSLGNSRCISDRPCIDQEHGGYAKMMSWQDGFEQWYEQIQRYLNGALERQLSGQWKPLTYLQVIIPVYAPTSDNNNEVAYINAIQHAVAVWQSGKVLV
ncbi:MAG: C39 family peptidase [Ktedonobacteraceae bacterium]